MISLRTFVSKTESMTKSMRKCIEILGKVSWIKHFKERQKIEKQLVMSEIEKVIAFYKNMLKNQ